MSSAIQQYLGDYLSVAATALIDRWSTEALTPAAASAASVDDDSTRVCAVGERKESSVPWLRWLARSGCVSAAQR